MTAQNLRQNTSKGDRKPRPRRSVIIIPRRSLQSWEFDHYQQNQSYLISHNQGLSLAVLRAFVPGC